MPHATAHQLQGAEFQRRSHDLAHAIAALLRDHQAKGDEALCALLSVYRHLGLQMPHVHDVISADLVQLLQELDQAEDDAPAEPTPIAPTLH